MRVFNDKAFGGDIAFLSTLFSLKVILLKNMKHYGMLPIANVRQLHIKIACKPCCQIQLICMYSFTMKIDSNNVCTVVVR